MKVRLLVDSTRVNEQNQEVPAPAGTVIDHKDAWRLCGHIVDHEFDRKTGKLRKRGRQRMAEPIDDEARAKARRFYDQEEQRLQEQRDMSKLEKEQRRAAFARELGVDYGETDEREQAEAGDDGSRVGPGDDGADSADVADDAAGSVGEV